MSSKLKALWRDIEQQSHKYRVRSPLKDENGRVFAEQVSIENRYPDPPLLKQLREREPLVESERMKAYLQACQLAPEASASTKKKWRRALGF